MAAVPRPLTPRAFRCRCGRPVFFRNSECLACHTPLGYDPALRQLLPLEPSGPAASGDGAMTLWRVCGRPRGRLYLRCPNLNTAAGCNWLVDLADDHATLSPGQAPLCRCCRLTRTLPDLSVAENRTWWLRIAQAQRRLVSALMGLGLPVKARTSEDPARGLVFDVLVSLPGQPRVMTGHADGVITLDAEEADDARREQRRTAMGEPYRTLLGHLRHETGHYYWQRLVQGHGDESGPWIDVFRHTFGDERQDYAAALQAHYQRGAPADWPERFVSAYASCHPWEDWAETWAHYLHLRDTLDTARSFGVDGETVELSYERFQRADLGPAGDEDAQAPAFLTLVNGWMELSGVLNELSRSMGVHDFYPFVLSKPALRKLHLVHRVIGAPA
ncbi:putative zinc-binding metallopeptidase [Ideonella sp. DXS29W]|uniref:Zinc-binding metallopeptidase n=1 Tax=Ideonella lacteola TaxID=2984193 RepID=A0ABU9BLP5_9BURK